MDGLLVEAVQAVHTFADLHKKELGGKGGGRVLFFSSRHALHQHRPAGNLCLPKNTFFALFQKGSGIKLQSKKMKNMLRTKKESLAINDM